MSSNPMRYSPAFGGGRTMEEDERGKYVKFDDYAAATAERDELKRKMAECREAWPHIVVAHLMDTNDDEIAAEATLNRHLGGE